MKSKRKERKFVVNNFPTLAVISGSDFQFLPSYKLTKITFRGGAKYFLFFDEKSKVCNGKNNLEGNEDLFIFWLVQR